MKDYKAGPQIMRECDGSTDKFVLPAPPSDPTDLEQLKEVVVYLRNPDNFGEFLPTCAENARLDLLGKLNKHIQKRILQGAE